MTNFTIGQQVINLGITATVVDFHKITGDPILWAPGTGKWLADAAKCEPATFGTRQSLGLFEGGIKDDDDQRSNQKVQTAESDHT